MASLRDIECAKEPSVELVERIVTHLITELNGDDDVERHPMMPLVSKDTGDTDQSLIVNITTVGKVSIDLCLSRYQLVQTPTSAIVDHFLKHIIRTLAHGADEPIRLQPFWVLRYCMTLQGSQSALCDGEILLVQDPTDNSLRCECVDITSDLANVVARLNRA